MKRREERYSDVLFGVPVSATTALNTSEPISALMRCDVPVTCGSLDRIVNIRSYGRDGGECFLRDQGRSCSVLPEAGLIPLHVSRSLDPTEGIQVTEA